MAEDDIIMKESVEEVDKMNVELVEWQLDEVKIDITDWQEDELTEMNSDNNIVNTLWNVGLWEK